ncbi:MAG: hypothetical protein K0U36_06435, partial [Alphaproteobacteria bacterium]|nr:hypothetical protein [Alphaproteobacteria bacterium]
TMLLTTATMLSAIATMLLATATMVAFDGDCFSPFLLLSSTPSADASRNFQTRRHRRSAAFDRIHWR